MASRRVQRLTGVDGRVSRPGRRERTGGAWSRFRPKAGRISCDRRRRPWETAPPTGNRRARAISPPGIARADQGDSAQREAPAKNVATM